MLCLCSGPMPACSTAPLKAVRRKPIAGVVLVNLTAAFPDPFSAPPPWGCRASQILRAGAPICMQVVVCTKKFGCIVVLARHLYVPHSRPPWSFGTWLYIAFVVLHIGFTASKWL